jgi:hypothetical protein
MIDRETTASRRRGARARWVALGVPLAALACGYLFLCTRAPRLGERASPPAADAAAVDGWVGTLAGPGGARLEARLTPLHAAPERQAFDARALERRLALEPGEPWLLVLRYRADDGPPSALAPAAELPVAVPALALARVEVHDEGGRAARALPSAAVGPATPADPLRVLLAPPAEDLAPGEEVGLVLWGRRPAGSARVEGLWAEWDDGRGFTAGALALHPRGVDRAALHAAVARLDRAGPSAPAQPVPVEER